MVSALSEVVGDGTELPVRCCAELVGSILCNVSNQASFSVSDFIITCSSDDEPAMIKRAS